MHGGSTYIGGRSSSDVGGRWPIGPHFKANGTFPPILILTDTYKHFMARSFKAHNQHSAIRGHAHVPPKYTCLLYLHSAECMGVLLQATTPV